jgi:hypothetical protein
MSVLLQDHRSHRQSDALTGPTPARVQETVREFGLPIAVSQLMGRPMTEYRHRHNPDGRWDSICMTCYRTAATSGSEAELAETETLHHCDTNISSTARRLGEILMSDAAMRWRRTEPE